MNKALDHEHCFFLQLEALEFSSCEPHSDGALTPIAHAIRTQEHRCGRPELADIVYHGLHSLAQKIKLFISFG